MPVSTSHPTLRPTHGMTTSTMQSTHGIEVNNGGNNQNAQVKPRQFGDIILPVTLVVLVGACALCCVVIGLYVYLLHIDVSLQSELCLYYAVIIRQLCIKSQRVAKKPRKYITAIQVVATNTDNHTERGPLSDTDSIDAQKIHHVHHVQPRRHHKDASDAGTAGRFESGQLTIPLKKKNTFCRNLQTHTGVNNMMMDDIIDEINTVTTSQNDTYYSTEEENKYSYEQDSADSDDTKMEKPHLHNYSTLTMRSGRVIAEQLQQECHPQQSEYQEITPSGFGRLQNAINAAKTHSDFDRFLLRLVT